MRNFAPPSSFASLAGGAPALDWSAAYVGIRYAPVGRDRSGCDCWGLVRLVYRDQAGIALPSYAGGYTDPEELAQVDALIGRARADGPWRPVDRPRPKDVALFRRGRLDSHLGIVVAPGRMLHMEGEDCAKITDYRTGRWAARLVGHYRHEAMR